MSTKVQKIDSERRICRVALAGNPNSGKTTLFNALTGAHLQVGNYPGVTVEKREGTVERDGITYVFTDLPGIYSLTAYSEDEIVSRDFLMNTRPDLVIDVLDTTNLARHLNLAMQLQELGIPLICALNMVEEAENKGITYDEAALSASLEVPFIKINAKNHKGVDALFNTISGRAWGGLSPHYLQYGDEVESQLEPLENLIAREHCVAPPRWFAVKLLEKDAHARNLLEKHGSAQFINAKAEASIDWLEKHFSKSSEIIIAEQRFGYIRGAVKDAETRVSGPDFSLTEAIDKVIMNPILALPLFIAVLWAVFQLTFTIGAYPQSWFETFFAFLSGVCDNALAEHEMLRSLVVDGIIAGVGGVFSFVPLIVILFFFLSILEDLGYMSRAAFATDKLLHTFGLHGQSIFPMMLGFGCSVPAIMASRTLKNKRDRIITVLVTPMMSCGAKLPIHVLLAGAFFGAKSGGVVMAMYAIGFVLSLFCAFVLKHTLLKGPPSPFVLELPPYRLPTLRGIGYHVWEKTADYLRRAGCVILVASILVWIFTSFPKLPESEIEAEAGVEPGAALEYSFAGRVGQFIEPIFAPLGFNWRMSIATLTGFAGKEIVVSTLGVLYHVNASDDPELAGNSGTLQNALQEDTSITPLSAFAFMLFMLLIPPCVAALGTIKAELGWKWLLFEFVFLFATGWIMALLVTLVGGALFGT